MAYAAIPNHAIVKTIHITDASLANALANTMLVQVECVAIPNTVLTVRMTEWMDAHNATQVLIWREGCAAIVNIAKNAVQRPRGSVLSAHQILIYRKVHAV